MNLETRSEGRFGLRVSNGSFGGYIFPNNLRREEVSYSAIRDSSREEKAHGILFTLRHRPTTEVQRLKGD